MSGWTEACVASDFFDKCAYMNDNEDKSFTEIADFIEQELLS